MKEFGSCFRLRFLWNSSQILLVFFMKLTIVIYFLWFFLSFRYFIKFKKNMIIVFKLHAAGHYSFLWGYIQSLFALIKKPCLYSHIKELWHQRGVKFLLDMEKYSIWMFDKSCKIKRTKKKKAGLRWFVITYYTCFDWPSASWNLY